jgi:hypothetical protein
MPQECAFNFTAASGRILGDDEDASLGIGSEPAAAPESAGGNFGLSITGFQKASRQHRVVVRDFLPRSPCVEEAALGGQNAVEAGEQKRRPSGGLYFK